MQSIPIAEILRGGRVESLHQGAYAVADSAGRLVESGGDAERAVFARSTVKALQALPLVAGGTAETFGFSQAELALCCASHTGSPLHADTALGMLRRAGRDETCLECGAHWPSSARATQALARAGGAPSALHNNCSGKHAGFVCTAIAGGIDPKNYVAAGHPVMRDVIAAVAEVTGARLDPTNAGVDGCSIPTHAIPLRALAAGFARFGTGAGLSPDFAAAAAILRQAVAANPLMVGGEGRFDSEVIAAFGEAVFVKSGAEGVICGALPERGLGFALKCDDGALRAAEAAAAALLRRLLGPHPVLDRLTAPVLQNWNGIAVGVIRAV